LGLALYLVGFSVAYIAIDAGIGALILFGGVQLTMFAGRGAGGRGDGRAALDRRGARHGGAGVARLARGRRGAAASGGVGDAGAALGWGVYSLVGRRATDPLAETAANFILAAPLCAAVLFAWPGPGAAMTAPGVILAVLSGAVTSGLGYALWYSVLPRLEASVSGLVQLSVPVIAMAGGALLLGEAVTPQDAGRGGRDAGRDRLRAGRVSAHQRLKRVVDHRVAPGGAGQRVGLVAQMRHLGPAGQDAAVHDAFGVRPWRKGITGQQRDAEVDVDLVESPRGGMELVDHAGRADLDRQAGFLVELPAQVLGQAGMRLHPAAGRAEQVAALARIGVHQQQPVLDQEDTPHGKAGPGLP
jgi:uncharacterized membrane protein